MMVPLQQLITEKCLSLGLLIADRTPLRILVRRIKTLSGSIRRTKKLISQSITPINNYKKVNLFYPNKKK